MAKSVTAKSAIGAPGDGIVTQQKLIVMRHGERLDTKDPSWKRTAVRVYDTPITKHGMMEANRIARARFIGKGIGIVYSSPFMRCLQTAQQVYTALGLEGLYMSNLLSEMLCAGCGMTGTPEVPGREINTADIVIKEGDDRPFPTYPEDVNQAVVRYVSEFKRLADLHWPDNLLLVTHEYGVKQAMAMGGCGEEVEATYCGSVQLSRTELSHQSTGLYVRNVLPSQDGVTAFAQRLIASCSG